MFLQGIFLTQEWNPCLFCLLHWQADSLLLCHLGYNNDLILPYDAMKVLYSICQQIWKTQQWPQDWKRPVFIPFPKKGNAKECPNYHTLALISHASKVMLKILQARLQQYMNCELPDVQAGFRKEEEQEIKLPTSIGSSKKQESSRKTSSSVLLTMPKPLTVWITINCGKF